MIDTGARLLLYVVKSNNITLLRDCVDRHVGLLEFLKTDIIDLCSEAVARQLAESLMKHKSSVGNFEASVNEWLKSSKDIPPAMFHDACDNATNETVKRMVKKGADPFSEDENGVVAISKAVLSNVEPRLKLRSLQNSDIAKVIIINLSFI